MKPKNKIRVLLINEAKNRQNLITPGSIKQNKTNIVNILLFARNLRKNKKL